MVGLKTKVMLPAWNGNVRDRLQCNYMVPTLVVQGLLRSDLFRQVHRQEEEGVE